MVRGTVGLALAALVAGCDALVLQVAQRHMVSGLARAPRPVMIFDRFRKKEEPAVVEEDAPPAASEMISEEPKAMKLSALDAMLVKFGMKNEEECELVDEEENIMEKVKCAGRAGIVSYIIWEWIFWLTAIPIACFTYYTASGSWPDLSNSEDQAKVGASVFAFVNVARFAVPLRVGLALSTTPWVDANIISRFVKDEDGADAGSDE